MFIHSLSNLTLLMQVARIKMSMVVSIFHFGTEQLMWPVLKGPTGPDQPRCFLVNSQAKVEQVSSNFGCGC